MFRHDLAYLSKEATYRLLDNSLPLSVTAAIQAMVTHHQPFVVCQQSFLSQPVLSSRVLSQRLPSPIKLATSCLVDQQKYRVALAVAPDTFTLASPLPLNDLLPSLAPEVQSAFQQFIAECVKAQTIVYVYGSYSHQYFSKQPFLHTKSDIDLLIVASDTQKISELLSIIKTLQQQVMPLLKIDGEIRLGDKDVAFNELITCLEQKIPTVLVKTLHETRLEPLITLLE